MRDLPSIDFVRLNCWVKQPVHPITGHSTPLKFPVPTSRKPLFVHPCSIWSLKRVEICQATENQIWINQPTRVFNSDTYAADVATLPQQVFAGGITLSQDEVIGVRMYDLGGHIEYRPALFLLRLAHQTDTKILETIGEVAAISASLGSGELAALGYEASTVANVLLWADRAAPSLAW